MAEELDALLTRGYRYALALTHDAARAEDLLQDAWLAMLRRGAPRHVGYLFRTIRNRFLDLEKRQRLVAIEPLDDHDHLAAPDLLPVRLELRDLEAELGELRAAERETLYLSAVEGHTVAEVASLTGRPLGSASSLIQRARSKLRRGLAAKQKREPR